jgi:hypothetical protein
MPDRYILTQSDGGNGTYISRNNLENNFYSYYLEGNAQNNLHFTLGETGNGRADQRVMTRMHITQTLPGTGFNIRRYFDIHGNVTGHNAADLPLNLRAQGVALMANSLGMYRRMAQEICNLLV